MIVAAARAQTPAPLTFHLLLASFARVPCAPPGTGVFVLSTDLLNTYQIPDKNELVITDVHGWMQIGKPVAGGVTFELRREEPADWPPLENVLNGYAAADQNGVEKFDINVNPGRVIPYLQIGSTHYKPSVCMLFAYVTQSGSTTSTPQFDAIVGLTVGGYLQPAP